MNFSNFKLIKYSNTIKHVFPLKNLLYINCKLLVMKSISQQHKVH